MSARPGSAGKHGTFEKLFVDGFNFVRPCECPMPLYCGFDGELGRECLNAPVCRMMLDGAGAHSGTDEHVRQDSRATYIRSTEIW